MFKRGYPTTFLPKSLSNQVTSLDGGGGGGAAQNSEIFGSKSHGGELGFFNFEDMIGR